jgi:MFS family permease
MLVKQLFVSKGHRTRLFLGMGLLFFKTFSGVQAVNYYSPIIFEQLGFRGTQNSLFATGIYGTVKAVCTVIFGLFVVDRIGRRRPLMFGSIVGSLCLIFLGGYLTGMGDRGTDPVRTAGDYVAIASSQYSS